MLWAMLTARLAATKDLPSWGDALVTIIVFGGFPFSGNKILFFNSLNCSAAGEWGLVAVTSTGFKESEPGWLIASDGFDPGFLNRS